MNRERKENVVLHGDDEEDTPRDLGTVCEITCVV